MARGSSQATGAATAAQNLSNVYSGNAAQLFSMLAPQYEAEAAHPAGLGPTTMAQMDTAAKQGAGGTQAAAVGSGALRAARSRNAAAGDAAIAESARAAGQQLSQATLRTRLADADLREKQRRSALSGLSGLFGEELSGGNQALGIVPQAVNANTGAINASWDWSRDLLGPILQAGAQSGSLIKAIQGGG